VYKHILIPTDCSELSERAVREGIDLANAMKARVTLLTASMPFHVFATQGLLLSDTPTKYVEDVERRAAQRLKPGEEYARSHGVTAVTRHVFAEHPYQAIVDATRSEGCDLICMASHARRGVAAVLIGSETSRVLSHSKVPVLVCR
jgi:nucleotide-binding universal stress UspA family protein